MEKWTDRNRIFYSRLYDKPDCRISDTLNQMIRASEECREYIVGENEVIRILDYIEDIDIRLEEAEAELKRIKE